MTSTLLVFFVPLFTGCSLITRPMDRPVIEDKINSHWLGAGVLGVLSLNPERRTVVVRYEDAKFCAEAPTEVGLDVNRLAQVALNAKQEGRLSAGLEALVASANTNTVLNRRSQGLQLFLVSSYVNCQMYLNNVLNGDQYKEIQSALLESVIPLITNEVKYMYENQGAGPDDRQSVNVQRNNVDGEESGEVEEAASDDD